MDKAVFLKKLGQRIAAVRKQHGLSQAELARKCDKDRQSINRLEQGNINPSAFYLHQLAQELGIPLAVLLEIDN